ncbi:class I SAM-dependent methyltransferase [Erythrobacter sp. NE805]|uniref:class I SAM-dependent methyltransferase n=1 Tax=Erythrobacter sp. NE805 TaxID=3389875 RepID=UPI00396B17D8
MSDLLIHSMAEFAAVILPCLEDAGAATITEVGSEFGSMSQALADHCAARGGRLTCIDPAPAPEFAQWAAARPHVEHVARPSLEVLADVPAADAWLIDGDHNYYTVFHELGHIDTVARAAGKPLLVFLHDVSWPCARRDFYYAPDRIPAEWRHPHSFEHGARLGCPEALFRQGWRGMGQFAIAMEEGGPRNGVLTAVEDFLAAADTPDRPLCYAHIPAVLGLGIIFAADAPWSDALAGRLAPYHQNPLIAQLEENRLRNYLEVIAWQDRSSAAA